MHVVHIHMHIVLGGIIHYSPTCYHSTGLILSICKLGRILLVLYIPPFPPNSNMILYCNANVICLMFRAMRQIISIYTKEYYYNVHAYMYVPRTCMYVSDCRIHVPITRLNCIISVINLRLVGFSSSIQVDTSLAVSNSCSDEELDVNNVALAGTALCYKNM